MLHMLGRAGFLPLCPLLVARATFPTFPTEYELEVLMKMPYSGLVMPLKISTTTTSQKIDYFYGTQVENSSASGTLKFVWNNSERVCLWSPPATGPKIKSTGGDSSASQWKPATIFPNLTGYTRVQDELGTGFHQYVSIVPHGTTGKMDDRLAFFWDPIMKKPVRWQMLARNPFDASHTDVWIFDYLHLEARRHEEISIELPKECHPKTTTVNSQLRSFLLHAGSLGIESVATDEGFEAYLMQHGKYYPPAEHSTRRKIFEKNAKLIAALNQRHAGRTRFKGNKFLDLTGDEVLRYRGGLKSGLHRPVTEWPTQYLSFVKAHIYNESGADIPGHFDWVTERPDVVGPVKDQGFCGSCWAFSLMAPVESATALKTGKRPFLPEQFAVDCLWNFLGPTVGGNSGCDGGDAGLGILEIVQKYNGKVPTAASYGSYMSIDGYCKDIRHMEAGAWIKGWIQITPRDEHALLHAVVTKGPISVAMITPDEMNFYDTGVFEVESCLFNNGTIDHAVALVGFGNDAGKNYYKIRNSWSTHWGENGYIRIVRGDLDCAIANATGYAELADTPGQEGAPMILYG